jgi:hypothetical protein
MNNLTNNEITMLHTLFDLGAASLSRLTSECFWMDCREVIASLESAGMVEHTPAGLYTYTDLAKNL